MSDLISTLADQIVALINTSPRSPTKAQIEELLTPFINGAISHGAGHRHGAPKCLHTWRPVQDAHGLFKQPVQECERCGILSIEEQIATLKETDAENVLCVCNQGQSRSAGIGMLYMAPSLPEDFEEAEAEYRKIYPSYNPGDGMRGFARIHWAAYRSRKGTAQPITAPEPDPALDLAQELWSRFAQDFRSDPTTARDRLVSGIRSALQAAGRAEPETKPNDGREC